MKPGIDPKVDYAFKRLFGVEANRPLLIHLLGAVLQPPPGQEIVEVDILNPFNDKENWEDKLSIVDIKARDQLGRQYNIEMQLAAHRNIRQRLLYYWARLHQQQLHEGHDYHQVRPTISICFLNDVLSPEFPEYHSKYELLHTRHHVPFSEDQALHIVELPKFQLAADQVKTPLELWCYFLCHADSLDAKDLPRPLDINPIQQAMEVLTVLTQTDIERERYEARWKLQLDKNSYQKELELERAEADCIGRIQMGQRLLNQPMSSREVLARLTLSELQAMASELERQLAAELK